MHYKILNTAIIHELLNDEVILANLDTGVYYSIRGSGISAWQLLILGYDSTFISSVLKEKYPAHVSLDSFVEQLVKEEILTLSSDPVNEAPLPSTILWPTAYAPPTLEKYEEMKDLLMLDPIHEVDEQGWPSRS